MARIFYIAFFILCPQLVFGMHIAEGFLPIQWSAFWTVAFIPFLLIGFKKIKRITDDNSKLKLLYAVVGAFVFVLSSLKLPSVAGSSSHLTGIALGAILFGASTMSVIGLIVLLFQAILLAHGGLTTLGANAFSMAVVGAFSAVFIMFLANKLKSPRTVAVFLAAVISDMLIYICTSFQLSLAFQSETASLLENMTKFLTVFTFTQLPLALLEGIFTVFALKLILKYNKSELKLLNPNLQ